MQLGEYRSRIRDAHDSGWAFDLVRLRKAIVRSVEDPWALRNMNMRGWYNSAVALGPAVLAEIYALLAPIFEMQCNINLSPSSPGEITLAGHANLFSCCGYRDCTDILRPRLVDVRVSRHDAPTWHFARALAGVALGEPAIYRDSTGVDVRWDEPLPFTSGERHGHNPQSLLAHLAAAVENHATIHDVWPAFEECVSHFPEQEQAGVLDGACLFWIARIVHHHIGGQLLGHTADWLSRHFNAWADGRSLPPI